MKKASCIGITIGIIISLLFTLFMTFLIAPLYLSLDLFGLQDAAYQYPPELYTKYYIELAFYFIFGILYISLLITMLIITIKAFRCTLSLYKIKKITKVVTIISIVSIIIYSIGTLIVNYVNHSNHVQWSFYLFTLIPAILYILITLYFSLTVLLSSTNNDLKEIEDNTI